MKSNQSSFPLGNDDGNKLSDIANFLADMRLNLKSNSDQTNTLTNDLNNQNKKNDLLMSQLKKGAS